MLAKWILVMKACGFHSANCVCHHEVKAESSLRVGRECRRQDKVYAGVDANLQSRLKALEKEVGVSNTSHKQGAAIGTGA